jgi:hypothetical protein
MMNKIFDLCVQLLLWIADLTGMTYEEVNVIFFVFLEPILFLILIIWIIQLKSKLKKLRRNA